MMNIFNLLLARRKRGNIRKYITDLGPLLASRYGKAEHYSPERVRRIIEEEKGFSWEEIVYALVIYCTPEKFAADQAAHGETGKYWPLRVEIMEYDFRHGHESSSGGVGNDLSAADQDARSGYGSIGGGFS